MFNRTLTTIIGIICLLTFSLSDDKFSSFRELKKISIGMSIIHASDSQVGIIAIHGFYPAYWVGIHHEWVQPFNYLVENEPLGTAGSLQLLPESVNKPFIVINGDVLTRLNPSRLLHFHTEHQAQATLCVREHEFTVPFGVVETNGVELAGFEEKLIGINDPREVVHGVKCGGGSSPLDEPTIG